MTATSLLSRDPATGEVVGEVRVVPVDRVADVVAAARRAQPAWSVLSPEDRIARLVAAAAAFRERATELAELITREMGKPVGEALMEVEIVAERLGESCLREIACALAPEEHEDSGTQSVVFRDPYGLCAVITPWNFPLVMPHWLVVPALMAGNAVVLKPSEETPLVGQAYADILTAVLPAGVLQVVQGGDDQGQALVEADVDLVALTGSRAAGKSVLASAGRHLKRVILELGGKDPLIVLEDADLDAAAEAAARGSFANAGQVCVSTERIYAHESIADAFVSRLVEHARSLPVGPGLDSRTRVGPLVNDHQRDHVVRHIDEAVAAGAVVAYGGDHDGTFVTPTVLVGVTPDMRIASEETFGPVASVTTVCDDDEAVRLANDTDFGLGAAVFGSTEHATAVARRLTAGMVGVNKDCRGAAGTPWVGAKQSGYGFHGSRDGHRQFAQTRVVSWRT